MKHILSFFILLSLTSCGVVASYDYDKETNFKNYNTYNYYATIESGLSQLDNKRIIKITDSILQLNGYTKSTNPDFRINFYTKEGGVSNRNTIGIGVGGGGRNVGYGISGGILIGGKTIDQQVTLDFIDAKQDRLIWQGIIDGAIKEKASPQWKEAYYKKIIDKILKKFPPK